RIQRSEPAFSVSFGNQVVAVVRAQGGAAVRVRLELESLPDVDPGSVGIDMLVAPAKLGADILPARGLQGEGQWDGGRPGRSRGVPNRQQVEELVGADVSACGQESGPPAVFGRHVVAPPGAECDLTVRLGHDLELLPPLPCLDGLGGVDGDAYASTIPGAEQVAVVGGAHDDPVGIPGGEELQPGLPVLPARTFYAYLCPPAAHGGHVLVVAGT